MLAQSVSMDGGGEELCGRNTRFVMRGVMHENQQHSNKALHQTGTDQGLAQRPDWAQTRNGLAH